MEAGHAPTGTRVEILDVAERLVQTRGYNGFSYADVASEIGLTKPALHYHYAGKSDLGLALIVRYSERFLGALDAIGERGASAADQLAAYANLYRDVLRTRRMCLCGILAAEHETLPPPMQNAVVRFFDANEAWLSALLRRGKTDGTLSFDGPADEVAQMIISGLEGAMLVAHSCGDPDRFERASGHLLASLSHRAGSGTGTTR